MGLVLTMQRVLKLKILFASLLILLFTACGGETKPAESDIPETVAQKVRWMVTPFSITASANTSDEDTLKQNFELSNKGNIAGDYRIEVDADWLSLSHDSGSLEPDQIQRIELSFAKCVRAREEKTNIKITGANSVQEVAVFWTCIGKSQPDISEPELSPLKANIFEMVEANLSFENEGAALLEFSLEHTADWLRLEPASGILAAGARQTIALEASCNDKAGEFQTELVLSSNDPNEATKLLPVQLTCQSLDLPDISQLSPSSMVFALALESSETRTLRFSNEGSEDLEFKVLENATWLSASPLQGSLSPGATQSIELTINCAEKEETLTTSLDVQTNDPDEATVSLAVLLDCLVAQPDNTPDITAPQPNPLSLTAYVEGQTEARASFSFRNLGNADLSFSVEKEAELDWLELPIATGTVAAGATQVLEVLASCESQVETKITQLTLRSNDPDEANKTLTVRLNCALPPMKTLTVVSSGATGQIISTPAGIDCGESCSKSFLIGTELLLEARGVEGSRFKAWKSDACETQAEVCRLTLSKDMTVEAIFETSQFNIELRFSDNNLSASQRSAFYKAAARWAEVIVADIPDHDANILGANCNNVPDFKGLIDDLLIDVTAPNIDGTSGVLGQAGPCFIRSSGLPYFGIMQLDKADLNALEAQGQLETVILHEMGHVLGIGTLWEFVHDFLDYSGDSCEVASSISYTGINGRSAYQAMGGKGNVPVEDTGSFGTKCGHWREETFSNELMTGYLNSGMPNPLSRITAGSLEDLGYTVNYSATDTYSFSGLRSQGQGIELQEILIRPKALP